MFKIFQFFFPKTIHQEKSSISDEIMVVEQLGRRSLKVAGLEQSGGFIKGIWQKALVRAQKKNPKVSRCLILGLGGGMNAQLVSRFWPTAKIVGVEIDPVVVRLGNIYFDLKKIPNLKIITADAAEFIKKKGEFDLILVDVYLGDQTPAFSDTREFLKQVRSRLAPGGLAIFNRLFYQGKKKEAERLLKSLEKVFANIERLKTLSNLLIFAQK